MANVIVDRVNRTITITKAFNAKASFYGTNEYRELAEVQAIYPHFYLIIKNPPRKDVPLSTITYAQMEKYIKSHDDENKSIWKEYLKLRGKTDVDEDETEDENEIEVKVAASFFEIKKWFAKKYSELLADAKARKKEIKEIIEKEAN